MTIRYNITHFIKKIKNNNNLLRNKLNVTTGRK